jgi:hypothetical protein
MDPSWSTVCKLADALGVPTEDFRGKPAARRHSGEHRRGRGACRGDEENPLDGQEVGCWNCWHSSTGAANRPGTG